MFEITNPNAAAEESLVVKDILTKLSEKMVVGQFSNHFLSALERDINIMLDSPSSKANTRMLVALWLVIVHERGDGYFNKKRIDDARSDRIRYLLNNPLSEKEKSWFVDIGRVHGSSYDYFGLPEKKHIAI